MHPELGQLFYAYYIRSFLSVIIDSKRCFSCFKDAEVREGPQSSSSVKILDEAELHTRHLHPKQANSAVLSELPKDAAMVIQPGTILRSSSILSTPAEVEIPIHKLHYFQREDLPLSSFSENPPYFS